MIRDGGRGCTRSAGSNPERITDDAGPGRARFPFFPCASCVGFGLAAGAIVKRAAAVGFALVFTAQYFSNLPYSIYPKSDFWRDSPALILIRVGIMLLLMAGAYLWTEFGMGTAWSWMLCFGKTSLMVYWVHVMLVYGDLAKPLKRALSIPQAALATLLVMLLMLALAAAWLWWKARLSEPRT
jgi:peptidoglycan/LPS O-acetylase OafA/YrhL